MTGALIILAVTLLTGLVLWLTHKPGEADGSPAPLSGPADGDGSENGECCGLHAVCERDLSPASAPVYYDDEDLDRFAGRQPDGYSDEEIDEFREVLYTLIASDVYPWGASLTRRGIALPVVLRDEWLMLCEDAASAGGKDETDV